MITKIFKRLVTGLSIVICPLSISLALTSCSDYTDIQPKGKNLLATTDQLEILLNYEMAIQNNDLPIIANDVYGVLDYIPNLLSMPNNTRTRILLTYNESAMDELATLTASDEDYEVFYQIIGTVANPILSKVDEAEGDERVKQRLKCEALTLRAWSHFMLVNKFAAAYNPSTAANTRAIAYVTEDQDIAQPTSQSTVQEVYEKIISDCDEAIRTDALPLVAKNRMRMSKPCPYAIKALALMAMQDYSGAEAAAKQALELSSTITDYNSLLTTTYGYILGMPYEVINYDKLQQEEDYFSTYSLQIFQSIPVETEAAIESGHMLISAIATDLMMYDYLMGMSDSYLGLHCTMTFDMNSGWNSAGLKSTFMYLLLAECEINKGNIDAAIDYLDQIRQNRFRPEEYVPLAGTVATKAEAIEKLKQTELGENIYSYFDFIFKKRWTQLADYKQDYTRNLFGTDYTITPGSKLWIFPFPQNVMNNNPNFQQNYK